MLKLIFMCSAVIAAQMSVLTEDAEARGRKGGGYDGYSKKKSYSRSRGSSRAYSAYGGSAVAFFANCSDARAQGAAPVRVGDPGYSRKLDRDGDGVGCE